MSTQPTRNGRKASIFSRLYTGTGAFDLIGKRKRFYLFFAALVLVCLGAIVFKGFNYSIEFVGGTQIQMPANGEHGLITTNQVTDAFTKSLSEQPSSVTTVGTGTSASIQIRAQTLTTAQTTKVETALFNQFQPLASNGKPSLDVISDSAVSASWGSQISQQALYGLIAFLVLVTIFLTIYFERWMAVAALIALANDLIVTAGVYSLVGWQVSPDTVIGGLTILGFSLYDAVVVFDKVKENTRGLLGLTRQTYAEAANLALNQTLMRSINTSLIAFLPVAGLLLVGVGVLGVGTLTDLSLVMMIGMLVGALSSLILATPLLVDLKMRQPAYQDQARRVMSRRAHLAKRAAERAAAGIAAEVADSEAEERDFHDDETLAEELRRERAMAAASSVPARHGKSRPAGKSNAKRRR